MGDEYPFVAPFADGHGPVGSPGNFTGLSLLDPHGGEGPHGANAHAHAHALGEAEHHGGHAAHEAAHHGGHAHGHQEEAHGEHTPHPHLAHPPPPHGHGPEELDLDDHEDLLPGGLVHVLVGPLSRRREGSSAAASPARAADDDNDEDDHIMMLREHQQYHHHLPEQPREQGQSHPHPPQQQHLPVPPRREASASASGPTQRSGGATRQIVQAVEEIYCVDKADKRSYKHRSTEMRKAALLALRCGASQADVCRQFNIAKRTLQSWRKSWNDDKTVGPTKPKGRKPKLSPEEQAQLQELLHDPTLSNAAISAQMGGVVAPRTVAQYAQRFGIKREVDSSKWFSPRQIKEIAQYLAAVTSVPPDRRVFVDDATIFDISGKRKPWTIHYAIASSGPLHAPILLDAEPDELAFLRYVLDKVIPRISSGYVVVWDLQRKSFRTKPSNPNFSQILIQREAVNIRIEQIGAKLVSLPRKCGDQFSPIMRAMTALKDDVRKAYAGSPAAAAKRPRTREELEVAVRSAGQRITGAATELFFLSTVSGTAFSTAYPNEWIAVQEQRRQLG